MKEIKVELEEVSIKNLSKEDIILKAVDAHVLHFLSEADVESRKYFEDDNLNQLCIAILDSIKDEKYVIFYYLNINLLDKKDVFTIQKYVTKNLLMCFDELSTENEYKKLKRIINNRNK